LDHLIDNSGCLVYVDLHRTSLRGLERDLLRAVQPFIPSDEEVIKRSLTDVQGRAYRIFMNVSNSETYLRPLFDLLHRAYWAIPEFKKLLSSLNKGESTDTVHKYLYIGGLTIHPIAHSTLMPIVEQDAHQDNTTRAQEISIALALSDIFLGTRFQSAKQALLFFSANTTVFAFDGFHRHKGPAHKAPVHSKYPYVGPGRIFFHFVAVSKSRKAIGSLQERDGMVKKAPILFDFNT
jgi:hypothetical protein